MKHGEVILGSDFYEDKQANQETRNTGGIFIPEVKSHPALEPKPEGSLAIPNELGGLPVKTIGPEAFKECRGLTGVLIPNTVTCIGTCAFSRCTGLSHITIPPSVERIEGGAFCECTGLQSVTILSGATILMGAFEGCSQLSSLMIPDTVNIAPKAFSECPSLSFATKAKLKFYELMS